MNQYYEIAKDPMGGLGRTLPGIYVSIVDAEGEGELHGPFACLEEAETFADESGAEKI